MCLNPCVSLQSEKNCREFGEYKIAVCEKIAGLRSGNSSDLNSACLKVLVPEKYFRSKTCTVKLNDITIKNTATKILPKKLCYDLIFAM